MEKSKLNEVFTVNYNFFRDPKKSFFDIHRDVMEVVDFVAYHRYEHPRYQNILSNLKHGCIHKSFLYFVKDHTRSISVYDTIEYEDGRILTLEFFDKNAQVLRLKYRFYLRYFIPEFFIETLNESLSKLGFHLDFVPFNNGDEPFPNNISEIRLYYQLETILKF